MLYFMLIEVWECMTDLYYKKLIMKCFKLFCIVTLFADVSGLLILSVLPCLTFVLIVVWPTAHSGQIQTGTFSLGSRILKQRALHFRLEIVFSREDKLRSRLCRG